jgi:hypothetical protein
MVLRVPVVPAMVQQARRTVPRVVQQPRVQVTLPVALVVLVREVAGRVAPRMAAPRRTRIRVLPVGPRIAVPVVPVDPALRPAGPLELVVLLIAELVGMPIAEPVVPGAAVPAVIPMVDPRVAVRAATLPAAPVLELPEPPTQRVTLPAVLAVPRPPELVARVRVLPRPRPRPRVVQDLSVVPRTAVPVAQRLVVLAVPAEQVRVVPVPRARAVLLMVAQVLPAVPGRAVPAVPRRAVPVVEPRPVMVVLVVAPLAAIPILPAVT